VAPSSVIIGFNSYKTLLREQTFSWNLAVLLRRGVTEKKGREEEEKMEKEGEKKKRREKRKEKGKEKKGNEALSSHFWLRHCIIGP